MIQKFIIVALFALISSPTLAGSWTHWATNNNANARFKVVFCQAGSHVTGIDGLEQYGYGLVDLRLTCSNGRSSAWIQNSTAQARFHSIRLNGIAYGMVIDEEAGHGIIDLRLEHGRGAFSDWLTSNSGTNYSHSLSCPRGSDLFGINTKEQSGYGIIDIRLYCD